MHIPKTGGTSFQYALNASMADQLVLAYPGNPNYDFEGVCERPLPQGAIVFGHFMWGLHNLFQQPPRYATVLRHPVQRLWSWYRYTRRKPDQPHHQAANTMSLGEMVRTGNIELNNHMTSMLAGRHLADLPAAEALTLAMDHLGRCAWLAVDTDIEESLPGLNELLGVELSLGRANVTPGGPLSQQDVEIVLEHNQLDLMLYEYAAAANRIRRAMSATRHPARPQTSSVRPAALASAA